LNPIEIIFKIREFSQKSKLTLLSFFTSQISNFRDNFSQNQEAKASFQLSEKNHLGAIFVPEIIHKGAPEVFIHF
jgi:hypothetical protein